ncbi:uncharacterized protein YccT (UPF0319 family) [Bradyrhizobium diazoefficiens]
MGGMMTADLQTGPTVAQAARLMNVSERLVYMVGELRATGRYDLLQAVERGDMSVLGALKLAKPEKYARPKKVTMRQLQTAYLAADERTKLEFLAWAKQA